MSERLQSTRNHTQRYDKEKGGRCCSEITDHDMLAKQAHVCSHKLQYQVFLSLQARNILSSAKHALSVDWPVAGFLSDDEGGRDHHFHSTSIVHLAYDCHTVLRAYES